MPRPPPPSETLRTRAGFSILELLAVMGIILLLLSVGVVSFSRARASAQAATCRENLRLWGGAFYLYAAEHRGRFPHTDDWTRSDKSGLPPSQSPHNHCWIDELPPYMGLTPWHDHEPGRHPTGNPWQCPAAKWGGKSDYSYNREREGGFSYAMNAYLSYDFDYGGLTGGESYLNTLRCTAPSRTILLFDQAANPTDGLQPQYRNRKAGRYPGEDVTALTTRHRHGAAGTEGANFLFLDGHVAFRNDVWVRQHSDFPDSPDDLEWFPYPYE